MSPADVEIRWVPNDNIYDLFVNGKFKNFYKTFGEAALNAEKAIHEKVDIVEQFLRMPPKKGKVRAS